MDFLDNPPDANPLDDPRDSDLGTFEIGVMKFKSKDVQLELQNVKITDFEGLRDLILDIIEELENK